MHWRVRVGKASNGSLTGDVPPVMKGAARLKTLLKSKGVSKGLGKGD